ncbi:MAG: hypothetical protein C4309_03750 [Chloroflexota bacterium]
MRLSLAAVMLFVGLSLVLAACGGAGATAPTPAAAGPKVVLTTSPDPPLSGNVELVLTVTDANGQPIPDADVYVFADHTEMSGMMMQGKATAQGGGRYAITANLSMSGTWKISVQVKKSPLNYTQDFNLEVQ